MVDLGWLTYHLDFESIVKEFMDIAPFYYWLIGLISLIGIFVLYSLVFGKKKENPTYNFQDEKRVLLEEISDSNKKIYEKLKRRFIETNPLKLKKMEEKSYELETRTIVSLLDECESVQEVFKMMDEEFYRWNWSSPMYAEFYESLQEIAEEVWIEKNKKDDR